MSHRRCPAAARRLPGAAAEAAERRTRAAAAPLGSTATATAARGRVLAFRGRPWPLPRRGDREQRHPPHQLAGRPSGRVRVARPSPAGRRHPLPGHISGHIPWHIPWHIRGRALGPIPGRVALSRSGRRLDGSGRDRPRCGGNGGAGAERPGGGAGRAAAGRRRARASGGGQRAADAASAGRRRSWATLVCLRARPAVLTRRAPSPAFTFPPPHGISAPFTRRTGRGCASPSTASTMSC